MEVELNTIKESLWLNIAAANVQAPAHAQLHKDHIMFASNDKPFILAGKETVLRAMTVKLYEDDINDFYAKQELSQLSEASCFNLSSIESISHGLCDLICGILELESLGGGDDIFAAGLDSLSVLKVLASIHNTLQSADKTKNDATLDASLVTASTIYKNPSIGKLSNALYKIVHPESQGGQDSASENIELMQSLLLKYTDTLPARSTPTLIKSQSEEISVILTGSTGSLGSYLLDTLLSKKHITRVFCLNRSTNGEERQIKGNKTRELQTDWTSQRVEFLHADLSKPMLGLDQDTYKLLLQQTTHIIHNQWQVDFNLTLSSFEPHIHGVRNLVDFSLATPNNASIFFISSVGIVNNQRTNASIPEALLTDFSVTEGGYGSSKLVSELMLSEAFIRSKVKSSVCRVGQISGPVEVQSGMWNKHEWLPSIIASSKHLGMLPSILPSLDRIDWLPVNQLAQIILELNELDSIPSSSTSPPPFMPIFHTVNPSTTPWSSLLPTIKAHLGSSVQIVPWDTWLLTLRASQEGAEIAQNPGIKLLDFYEAADRMGKLGLELSMLETVNTEKMSKTLKEMGKVTPEWMGSG
ncbi:Non-canonical non-ribosomal peptide synthetase [Lachnellula subtilissima]|uniref:Non-canonical non-ribosomal peptide synthetase n=1 Tax=Lachnellula subtilissima TaxID=602034 RepID=A0A8H8S005_9HELO|nr:Non-canonical non-ribosomal peptide synthetase [Lachnellula subtilissima]